MYVFTHTQDYIYITYIYIIIYTYKTLLHSLTYMLNLFKISNKINFKVRDKINNFIFFWYFLSFKMFKYYEQNEDVHYCHICLIFFLKS